MQRQQTTNVTLPPWKHHADVRVGRSVLLWFEHGADVRGARSNGVTALMVAAGGHEAVAGLLLSHGADAAERNWYGR